MQDQSFNDMFQKAWEMNIVGLLCLNHFIKSKWSRRGPAHGRFFRQMDKTNGSDEAKADMKKLHEQELLDLK